MLPVTKTFRCVHLKLVEKSDNFVTGSIHTHIYPIFTCEEKVGELDHINMHAVPLGGTTTQKFVAAD
jgi:hypothetical protein